MNEATKYDTFLSHSHKDAEIVQYLALKLEEEHNLKIWLDKFSVVPGEPFIPALSKGIANSKTCVIVIGKNEPEGWFRKEIEKALNKNSRDSTFRVFALLLPEAKAEYVDNFLELHSWVRFKLNVNEKRPFHELTCGIKGIPPGKEYMDNLQAKPNIHKKKLEKLKTLHDNNLIDISVLREYQKSIVRDYLKNEHDD